MKKQTKEFLGGEFAPMMVVLNLIGIILEFTNAWHWGYPLAWLNVGGPILWLNVGGLVLGWYYYSLRPGGRGGSH